MKFIERTLLALTSQNLADHTTAIQAEIAHWARNKGNLVDMAGISLIPVRDLLDKKYSDEELRGMGFILTVEQLQEDAEKYLLLAAKNPILYNSQLKRLYRSCHVLEQVYGQDFVKNHAFVDEIKRHFSKILLACYCDGEKVEKKMPEELVRRITLGIEDEVKKLSQAWIAGKVVAKEIDGEYTEYFSGRILQDWQAGALDLRLSHQLQVEKDKINKIDEFLMRFRGNRLPAVIQAKLSENVIEEVITDILSKKLTVYSDLGAALRSVQSGELLTDHFNIISTLLGKWQTGDVTQAVSTQLESYVRKAIGRVSLDLEEAFSPLFAETAAQNFFKNLRQGQYKEDIEVVRVYVLQLAKQINDLPQSKNFVYSQVMADMHDMWKASKLSTSENEFIQQNIFSFLHQISARLREQIWKGDSQSRIDALEKKVETLLACLDELSKKSQSSHAPILPVETRREAKPGFF